MTPQGRFSAASTDFDGTRLNVARRLRAMTKTELARALNVTPTAIAQYEKGMRPTQSVMARACLVLGMPRDFFGAGSPITSLPASAAHFRSLRSTTSRAREQVLAYGELSLELVALVSEYVDFPPVDLPDLLVPEDVTPGAVVDAARAARLAWGIERGPIPSVVQLLEAHGVIVLRLPQGTDRRVDALSTYAGARPLVFLNDAKEDKARSRFDAAHELGHLLLHPDTEPGSKVVEQQANQFASEFLMPAEEIIDQLPRRIDWPAFHDLKRHWGVSLRALVYRAHHLGTLSEASYRRANQQLSIWGYPEPGALGAAESPQMLGLATGLLVDGGIDLDAVLAQARLAVDAAEQIIQAGSEERLRVVL